MQDGTFSSSGHLDVTAPSLRGDVFAAKCPTRTLLDRLADKWTFLVLSILEGGAARFSQLKRRIDGVSQKMLSQTLRQLERDGLVIRTVVPTTPVSVSYALTPTGLSLVRAVQPVIDWAETHMHEVSSAQVRYDASRES